MASEFTPDTTSQTPAKSTAARDAVITTAELLESILEYLTFTELLSVRGVAPFIRDAIKNSPKLRQILFLQAETTDKVLHWEPADEDEPPKPTISTDQTKLSQTNSKMLARLHPVLRGVAHEAQVCIGADEEVEDEDEDDEEEEEEDPLCDEEDRVRLQTLHLETRKLLAWPAPALWESMYIAQPPPNRVNLVYAVATSTSTSTTLAGIETETVSIQEKMTLGRLRKELVRIRHRQDALAAGLEGEHSRFVDIVLPEMLVKVSQHQAFEEVWEGASPYFDDFVEVEEDLEDPEGWEEVGFE